MSTRLVPRPVLLLTLGALAAPAWAIGCDELRDSIGARIRAGGVSSFSLTVVAADASAPGSVVGSCERGTRKILYVKGAAGTGTPAPAATPAPVATAPAKPAVAPASPVTPGPAPAPIAAARPKVAAPEVITECDDGSSVTHGECKKP